MAVTRLKSLVEQQEAQGKSLPIHVHQEFEAYLKCGRLEHGFLRVRCDTCQFERLVAFSRKKRGFCPSCGARRMVETAALLADEVFPDVPLRQWVISFPFPLRFLLAAHPQAMGKVVYTLKTPYRDGTTQVAFDPVDFMARLAALVPQPRVNLTRYHGVLAPNHRWRGEVTPARRGKELKKAANAQARTSAERHQEQGELMRSIKRRCPGVRCLFLRERNSRYLSSISGDATEHSVGMGSCGLQLGNDHKRSASGPVQARFQHTW